MKEYQKKVIAEKVELQVKLNQLGNFINQGESPTLTAGKEKLLEEERHLMEYQYLTMEEYLDTLKERIKLFK